MSENSNILIRQIEQSISERFEYIVWNFPGHEAVRFKGKSISYAELNEQANRLSHAIISKIDDDPAQIAIFLEQGILQIVTLLAVLKAGKAYVPLDTSFPAERNMHMLKNAQCSLLISNNLNLSQAREFTRNIKLINADDINDFPSNDPSLKISPDDNSMILYTSGSTGKPKGVCHTHKTILQYIKRFTEVIEIKPQDRFSHFFSLSFSAHTMQILTSLLNGTTLCIFDLKSGNFTDFSKWIASEEITISLMIPSVLRHFLATLRKNTQFPKLRLLLIGGETLYRNDVEKARQYLKKKAVIMNIYASTETHFARVYKIMHNTIIKSNVVPIGYEVQGVEMTITDEEGNRKDPNKIGEIRIKSPYIASGYWNLPKQTSTDFLIDQKNPDTRIFKSSDLGYKQSDGCIVHIGRSDSMVKLRGYRIDLGEIENVLIENKDVKEVIVLVKENPYGTKHIVAYIVPKGDKDPDLYYLKLAVLRMLPEYMVPSYFVKLETLPKNEIGKIDKKAIPDPDWNKMETDKDVIQPKTAVEEELREIFERILEVHPISITDNILELGADSLRLFVAFDEIEKKYGKKLNIDVIVETPTIEKISIEIENN